MANIEEMVNSMGMTFFCNAMVEGLYYFREEGSLSKKLEINCKRAIAKFESLKWPFVEKTYPDIIADLFNSNKGIHIFEEVCKHYETPAEQMINETITDLKYIISENSRDKKLKIAHKLQLFFDVFGDYSFCATKDCIRD